MSLPNFTHNAAVVRSGSRNVAAVRPCVVASLLSLLAAAVASWAFASSRAQPAHANAAPADAPAQAQAHPRELILAGGSLKLCSSLSSKDCIDPAAIAGPRDRAAPRYRLDAVGIALATDPRLWPGRDDDRRDLRRVLEDAARAFRDDLDEDALRDALESRCEASHGHVRSCRGGVQAPWSRLDDDHRAAVLAALERPQLEGDERRRERASLEGGRTPHGAQILRAFVAAAQARSGGRRPRVAVVTASSFDPFDPVDVYVDALTQAGAEVEWWPVDAALAAAVFERQDCAALPSLRLERLRLPARERVYPDLVAQQQRACADPAALVALPSRVQGVFFSGGDQWKLRRAFFDRHDAPNPWLRALRDAVARGEVAIGGTSAGSAVQSGGPMLSNGTVEAALQGGAIASPPPTPGCARSRDCVGGLDENAFTYWPNGGLGLAPGMVVDTHFSERARELRLLRLLADTGARLGVGVDETSALHLRWRGEHDIEARALGASGGWVFELTATPCDRDRLQAVAHYLAPGETLWIGRSGAFFSALPLGDPAARADAARFTLATAPSALNTQSNRDAEASAVADTPADALADGALRAAVQALARDDAQTEHTLRAGDGALRVSLRRWPSPTASAPRTTAAPAGDRETGMRSAGPFRVEAAPWPGCPR